MNYKEDSITEQLPELSDIDGKKFLAEVLEGSSGTPKRLQSKYFYDQKGDALFQQIMDCPEYYLSLCEAKILQNRAPEMSRFLSSAFDSFDLIELGSGDGTKSQYLLQSLINHRIDFTYMPIDISGNILSELQTRLQAQLQDLNVAALKEIILTCSARQPGFQTGRKSPVFP